MWPELTQSTETLSTPSEARSIQMFARSDVEAAIYRLVSSRAQGKTVCPSEVARTLTQDWRPHMQTVRSVAFDMARDDRVAILQRGIEVSADSFEAIRGPIRIGHTKCQNAEG